MGLIFMNFLKKLLTSVKKYGNIYADKK